MNTMSMVMIKVGLLATVNNVFAKLESRVIMISDITTEFKECEVTPYGDLMMVMMMNLAGGQHRNHKAAYRVTSTVNKASLIALFIPLLCECDDDDDK